MTLSLLLRVTAIEFALLSVSILTVLCAELLNTAIEAVVDLVSPEYHPLAKIAKDTAAGAVLVAACGAGIMGYLILSSYIFPHYGRLLAMIGTTSDISTLISVLIVTIAVIIIKSITGKGKPLHGGLPSGHAAIAFSIATAVTITTKGAIASILSYSLAIMVSHSRLLMHIHTIKEVIAGAFLGIAITAAVQTLFIMAG